MLLFMKYHLRTYCSVCYNCLYTERMDTVLHLNFVTGTPVPIRKGVNIMKKKLISLLLALTVLCTGLFLTGCGNEDVPEETKAKTAFEIIDEALQKTQNLESMDAKIEMEMSMGADGFTMTIPMSIKIMGKDLKAEKPVLSTVISMSMLGQSIEMEIYQEDQWAYMVMDEMKYKLNVKDATDELDYAENADYMLQEIPEELLKDVQPVTAADGSQTFTVNFPEETFDRIYDELIESVGSNMGTDIEDAKISDAVATITVADGYVTVYDLAFNMEMTAEGVSTTTAVKATCTYNNPGQPVTVTPPEGYQDFEELSALLALE